MPVFFGLWRMNSSLPPPPDPKAEVMQQEAFLALYQSQLKSGVVKEAHSFVGSNQGYFISGDVTIEALHEAVQAWDPYVIFEIHSTIKFPKALEVAIAVAKQRAAMKK